MKVILIKDVKALGKAGQIVDVSDGHARNLLLPKGFAKEASEHNVNALERKKKEDADKRQNDKESAVIIQEKIQNLQVKITTKAGDGGKLFGAITSKDIAEALLKQHKIDIDKKKFALESPIKHIGEYEVDIKLYQGVVGKLKVQITA
ncbi:MAG: 50S ribosomal protein L9 [Eubacteriales bacterium]